MITGRDRHRRLEVLEACNQPSTPPGKDDVMPIIWQVLEDHPSCQADLLKIKGLRQMSDEEALPLMMDTLDNHPEAKAAIVIRLKQEQQKG